MKSTLLAVFITLLSVPHSLHAQGFVAHMEPPVLERGKTTRVTIVGTDLGKAFDLWSSLPAGALQAKPSGEASGTRATLDVTVAADAPVGVCGARLATVDGLSNAFLVLIDDLPVRAAAQQDKAAKEALPVSLWGRFRESKVDRYAIDVAAGQKVGFEVVGNRLGKDIDPLVTIRDAAGRIVAEHDNDPGLYFDCRFEHVFAAAGSHIVEVRDARFHGDAHGMVVLRMGKFPAARVAVPSAIAAGQRAELRLPELADTAVQLARPAGPVGAFYGEVKRSGDEGSTWLPLESIEPAQHITMHQTSSTTLESATPAAIPGYLCGALKTRGERHYFRLDLSKGQKIQVRAEARALNSPADLEMSLFDAKGKEVRRVTENLQKEEIAFDFAAGAPGAYVLAVRDVHRDGGPAFAYRLEVRTGQPQIQASADVEGLTVPRDSYQPIPITVTRTDYTGPIALALQGAPAGLTLTPSEMEEGVNSIVCKLSAAVDAPLGIHTIQIRATPVKAENAPIAWVLGRPLIDRQIVNVDLIPHALREDQRRLPPALADRFAVQITPPAPFAFALPEANVTLARYQHVEFPTVITRSAGFTDSIRFKAKGGQIASKEEGRTRVYAEFADGKGAIHSKILTNLAKHRVEVSATGGDKERRVTLTRTFDLEIRSAFVVTPESTKLALVPGASAKVRLLVDRMKLFDGEVHVALSPSQGMAYPESVRIPSGQTSVEFEIRAQEDRTPGKININLISTGTVGAYEEEVRGGRVEVEVTKPAVPKK